MKSVVLVKQQQKTNIETELKQLLDLINNRYVDLDLIQRNFDNTQNYVVTAKLLEDFDKALYSDQ